MRLAGGVACAGLALALCVNGPAGAAEARPGRAGRDRLFGWMVGGYVGLQAADLYLTRRGARLGLEEANPALSTGRSVAAGKAALVPLTTWGLVRLHRRRPRLATGLAIGLNALYLGVAVHNARVLSDAE